MCIRDRDLAAFGKLQVVDFSGIIGNLYLAIFLQRILPVNTDPLQAVIRFLFYELIEGQDVANAAQEENGTKDQKDAVSSTKIKEYAEKKTASSYQ